MRTDPAASSFEDVIEEHQEMVFRTLRRLVGRPEAIEDLAQEVFLRLYRALPSFRGDALVTTYLYRIVVNVAQDEWRRRQRSVRQHVSLSDEESGWADRLEHPGLDPLEELEGVELQSMVECELLKLKQVERAVLVLYHQEQRSYLQIAHALGLPVGTVRTHLHRGRTRLKTALRLRGKELT